MNKDIRFYCDNIDWLKKNLEKELASINGYTTHFFKTEDMLPRMIVDPDTVVGLDNIQDYLAELILK